MQILFWKKRAEEELQRSGLDYTIIRPGELLCSCRSCMLGGLFLCGSPVACPDLHSSCLVSLGSYSCCCACQEVSTHAVMLDAQSCKCSPMPEHRRRRELTREGKQQNLKPEKAYDACALHAV